MAEVAKAKKEAGPGGSAAAAVKKSNNPATSAFNATNFLRQFRDKESRELKQLSAAQFMGVWEHYDSDGNGYIEGTELDSFLREFVASVNSSDSGPEVISDTMLSELKTCFLEAYDDNKDGKIDIREIQRVLLSIQTDSANNPSIII